MLEYVPGWLGHLLSNIRAGSDKLVIAQGALGSVGYDLALSSPAFTDGARLPERFTADSAGVSPPLIWREPPAGTQGLALIVEDPDAPAANPLVHAIVWNIPPHTLRLEEGAIRADGAGGAGGEDVGRNSFLREGWLPPDPPTGHGEHDYVFQLFALSQTAALASNPGRADVVGALEGHVLAAGVLIGTYSRGEVVTRHGSSTVTASGAPSPG